MAKIILCNSDETVFCLIAHHLCLELPFVVCSILKQCWSVGYVSYLAHSFFHYLCHKNLTIPYFIILICNKASFAIRGPSSFKYQYKYSFLVIHIHVLQYVLKIWYSFSKKFWVSNIMILYLPVLTLILMYCTGFS